MKFDIRPMPKPRMTRADRWKKRKVVLDYFAWCALLRNLTKDLLIDFDELYVVFNIEMPASWSEKKKLAHIGKPHRQRPDVDNLFKALFDALNKDDSHIYKIGGEKLWSRKSSIEILKTKNVMLNRYADIATSI